MLGPFAWPFKMLRDLFSAKTSRVEIWSGIKRLLLKTEIKDLGPQTLSGSRQEQSSTELPTISAKL
jgi:hypothetical protein